MSYKNKQIPVYIPKPFYRDINNHLKKTGQNFNGYIKGLIVNDLREKGVLGFTNAEKYFEKEKGSE